MKKGTHDPSRRYFIKNSLAAGILLPLMNADIFAGESTGAEQLNISIFSKHLQFLNYNDLADAAASMGFDGVDLTVRPEGHVLPERVEQDLPKAIEALKKTGVGALMMTTAVDDAGDPIDNKVLSTAAKLGIRYYRMNWFPYPEDVSMPAALKQYEQRMKALGELNRQLNITGCYQNHAGNLVGASPWELYQILTDADKNHLGVQYDIRHAMVEGGTSWENGLRLVAPHIKSLTIKDFIWTNKGGKWVVQDVPVGEGMVDFKNYFGLLKKYKINVPVSLHIEYDMGGAEHGASHITIDKKEVFASVKKDLQKIRQLWEES